MSGDTLIQNASKSLMRYYLRKLFKVWKLKFSLYDYGVAVLFWFIISFVEWGQPLVPIHPVLARFIDTFIVCLWFPIIFDLAVLMEDQFGIKGSYSKILFSLSVGALSFLLLFFIVGWVSDRILTMIGFSDRIADILVEMTLMSLYAALFRIIIYFFRNGRGKRER